MKAHLFLTDGTHLEGQLLGAEGERFGEIVFNTGMTGYQEVLTDPSYAGQMVIFTYPMIGNYGINDDDFESDRIQPESIIVREACHEPSNWRSSQSIHELLVSRQITAIEGLDTRALTKRIRSEGVTMGVITTNPEGAVDRLRSHTDYGVQDYVGRVSTPERYSWGYEGRRGFDESEGRYKARIAVIDCGLKYNILRRFAALGVESFVFPSTVEAREILDFNPDGILLSPGPGDPERLDHVVNTVKTLLGQKPIFGICLGNQILCRAVGGSTYKMKFGHRGSNHPVKDLLDDSVTITSQNHGYAVDPESLVGTEAEVTQINLNDGTVEGIQVKGANARSIQYHPEAAPGPWDSRKYFVQFVEEMTGELAGSK
ncbi:MAG: glutamine-hydrolyzing carbamoyl-phosphate synthase small subunit [Armatimonadetes bacterium]|nr:glutamine-hydrolyzing carbamoyl-phosphate synthase small subunit [Armatimonadota bacterium]